MSTREPVQLLEGLGFGEGLRWHDDRLWFSDFYAAHGLHRSTPVGATLRVEVELDERPSGLGWLPDGRLLVVGHGRPAGAPAASPTAACVMHADLVVGAPRRTPTTWSSTITAVRTSATSASTSPPAPSRPAPRWSGVVRPDGDACRRPSSELAVPERVGHHRRRPHAASIGESFGQRLLARSPSDADGHPGRRAGLGRPPAASVPRRHARLDADGAIWFADAMAPEVVRVAEGGEVLDVITVPDRCFACALGGPDGRTLFVATASTFPGRRASPTGRVGSGRSRSTCPTPVAPEPRPPHRRSGARGDPTLSSCPARASLDQLRHGHVPRGVRVVTGSRRSAATPSVHRSAGSAAHAV